MVSKNPSRRIGAVKVLVVIPTYNESMNVEAMVQAVRRHVPQAAILVVDDGSPDGTADMAEALEQQLGSIHVLRRTEKAGLGSAYRAGFEWGLREGFDAFVRTEHEVAELLRYGRLSEINQAPIVGRALDQIMAAA